MFSFVGLRLGRSLRSKFYKGSVVRWEKRLHINVLELKAVSLALQSFKDQCQNQTVLVAMDNSTVVAYINKQGGTHSAEMCALLWKIMTWCHRYHITLKARHIPGCLNVMADLSRSNQVQSTEWSLHPQVFKQICQKWFTPHVDLFATHLNHKLPALNRDPTATPGVNNSSQTVPQLCVPQQSTTPQPPRLVSRSGQLQEQGFSGGGRENCCPSEVINKDYLQVKVGPI